MTGESSYTGVARGNLVRHHYVCQRTARTETTPEFRPSPQFPPDPARIRNRRRIRLSCGIAGLAALLAVGGMVALPVSAQETPYEVTLTGVEDSSLRDLLEGTATLFRLNEQPPPSPVGLRRRADADRERIADGASLGRVL